MLVPATLLVRGGISTGTHWLNHKLPWLWRIHRVHHLDSELDVTSTLRGHGLAELREPHCNHFVRLLLSPLRKDLSARVAAGRLGLVEESETA